MLFRIKNAHDSFLIRCRMNLMLLVSVIFGAGNTHDCAFIKSIGSSFLSIHFIPDNLQDDILFHFQLCSSISWREFFFSFSYSS